ncbi:MAG: T9SS type A sorting domain-containing protein [Flavobacteriaceae bacterium]|nr:T9SS type A sorting domain-containing protein [Bacteroidia bacterium]NNK88575.1 T9SS type A sorting domain-containing protein [Flavobacteriaceae bacterium]
MKRFLLMMIMGTLVTTYTIKAQTTIWSSNCENLAGWIWDDIDGDGNNWFYFTGGENVGFQPGQFLASPSMTGSQNNAIRTPVFNIPGGESDLSLSFRIGASSDTNYQETYYVYIQENGVGGAYDNLIHQATLTDGGTGSAQDVSISIPDIYAGKDVYLSIRHSNPVNQEFLMVDDFLVTSGQALSVGDSDFELFSIYPNPTRKVLNIYSNVPVDQAEVYNLLGQKVMAFNESSLLNQKIDVSNLQTGNYLLKVTINSESQIYRFIKN